MGRSKTNVTAAAAVCSMSFAAAADVAKLFGNSSHQPVVKPSQRAYQPAQLGDQTQPCAQKIFESMRNSAASIGLLGGSGLLATSGRGRRANPRGKEDQQERADAGDFFGGYKREANGNPRNEYALDVHALRQEGHLGYLKNNSEEVAGIMNGLQPETFSQRLADQCRESESVLRTMRTVVGANQRAMNKTLDEKGQAMLAQQLNMLDTLCTPGGIDQQVVEGLTLAPEEHMKDLVAKFVVGADGNRIVDDREEQNMVSMCISMVTQVSTMMGDLKKHMAAGERFKKKAEACRTGHDATMLLTEFACRPQEERNDIVGDAADKALWEAFGSRFGDALMLREQLFANLEGIMGKEWLNKNKAYAEASGDPCFESPAEGFAGQFRATQDAIQKLRPEHGFVNVGAAPSSKPRVPLVHWETKGRLFKYLEQKGVAGRAFTLAGSVLEVAGADPLRRMLTDQMQEAALRDLRIVRAYARTAIENITRLSVVDDRAWIKSRFEAREEGTSLERKAHLTACIETFLESFEKATFWPVLMQYVIQAFRACMPTSQEHLAAVIHKGELQVIGALQNYLETRSADGGTAKELLEMCVWPALGDIVGKEAFDELSCNNLDVKELQELLTLKNHALGFEALQKKVQSSNNHVEDDRASNGEDAESHQGDQRGRQGQGAQGEGDPDSDVDALLNALDPDRLRS